MKKKNLNKKLKLKTISVCDLNQVHGGRAGGTHYAHCEPVKWSDWCTFTCQQ